MFCDYRHPDDDSLRCTSADAPVVVETESYVHGLGQTVTRRHYCERHGANLPTRDLSKAKRDLIVICLRDGAEALAYVLDGTDSGAAMTDEDRAHAAEHIADLRALAAEVEGWTVSD